MNEHFETRCVHAGQSPDPTTGSIMTPIYQTSTYAQPSPGVFKDGYDYARSANPTRTALEANLASIEGGNHGLAFGSGCAATSAVLQSLRSGDHVLLCDDVYGGTFRIYDKVFKQFGIDFTLADMTDDSAYAAAFTPNTKMVWIETPTNPTLKIIDIAAVAVATKAHGAFLVVDNTFATPATQRPLEHGADVVCHSVTKYIGGHTDVVGGCLVTNDQELHERFKFMQNAVGGVPSPFDCFLLLRSTKTLHLRMERHCQNAMVIAKHLQGHAKLGRVIYPGLDDHPQHELAKKQMPGFGGIISIEFKSGLDGAKRFCENIKVFTLAESLGGVESLVNHPSIMTHASVPADQRAVLGITDSLVRLSVGIEDVGDLIADLDQAMG